MLIDVGFKQDFRSGAARTKPPVRWSSVAGSIRVDGRSGFIQAGFG